MLISSLEFGFSRSHPGLTCGSSGQRAGHAFGLRGRCGGIHLAWTVPFWPTATYPLSLGGTSLNFEGVLRGISADNFMSQKKSQQHVVPRVYLNAFCETTPPANHPEGRPYTGALWIVPPSLTQKPWRRSPRNVLRQLNAYTLRSDDPRRPQIEERLSQIESEYAPVLRQLRQRSPLTEREWIILSVFVATLYLRTPGHMAHWQQQIDKLQYLYRQLDRAHSGHEQHSDEYWAGADEFGKQQVLGAAGGIARLLVANGLRVLVNNTNQPFITCDRPVVHRQMHVDELSGMGFPEGWFVPEALPNQREFFSYCALTPEIAVVACPLFVIPRTLYWLAATESLVMNLNLVVRDNAAEWLISSRAEPFGAMQARIVELENLRRALPEDPRPILTVYTDRTRVRLRMEEYKYGLGPMPINGRLSFRTRDMAALRTLAEAAHLPEVTYQAPDQVSGGMRNAWVIAVALSPEGETIIMNGPG